MHFFGKLQENPANGCLVAKPEVWENSLAELLVANVFLGVPFPAALPSDWCLPNNQNNDVDLGGSVKIRGSLNFFPPNIFWFEEGKKKEPVLGSHYTWLQLYLNSFDSKIEFYHWIISNTSNVGPLIGYPSAIPLVQIDLAPPKPSQLQSLSEDLLDTRLVYIFFQATHPFEKTDIYIYIDIKIIYNIHD